jgi:uncharacterized protein YceK
MAVVLLIGCATVTTLDTPDSEMAVNMLRCVYVPFAINIEIQI